MLYSDFILKAKDLTIQQEDNGEWYLEPEWQDMLYRNGLGELDNLEDSYLSGWYDVEDILKLEVERRNIRNSKKKYVIDWLYDVLTTTVEPAILQEETDYIKQVVEFMRTNHSLNTGDPDGDNIIPFPTKE